MKPRSSILLVAVLAACAGPQSTAPSTVPSPAPLPTSPPPSTGTAPEPAAAEGLDRWIADYVEALGAADATQAFHGELLVARGGQVVVHRAFHHASTGGRFRIGSVTKPFTAVAILQLAEAGKLRLDQAVRDVIPELPARFDEVTLEQLLVHRGGLGSYTSNETLMAERDRPHDQAAMIALIAAEEPVDAPGARWSYSNSGYYLLGVVIERVAKQRYHDYLREHLFEPAGMKDTGADDRAIVPGLKVEGDALVEVGPIDLSVPFSAGALSSTVADMHRFALALRDDTLLPEAWRERMWTDHGGPTDALGWGYGWMLRRREGVQTVGHNGGIDGFVSGFEMTREPGWIVVSLANSEANDAAKVGAVALRMAVSNEPVPPPEVEAFLPFDPELGAALAGDYRLSPDAEAELRAKLGDKLAGAVRTATLSADGKYIFKPVGQGPIPMKLREDGVLRHPAAGISLTPERNAEGLVVGLTLKQGKLLLRYTREDKPASK